MIAVWLTFGVIAGALLPYLVLRVRLRGGQDLVQELREERDAAASEAKGLLGRIGDDREKAARELEGARKEAAEEIAGVRKELADVNTALATVQMELRKEREAHTERVRELREAQSRLDERVKAALSEALGGSTKQLVALAKAQLGEERAQAKRELDKTDKKFDEMFKSVSGTLEKVTGKLDEIEKERIAAREQLDAQLSALKASQGELLAGTQALAGALRRPHVRGRWGEVQLRNVVEAAGMLPHVDFDEQPTVSGEDGSLRPDACVHLPGRRDVVIDAKVPLEAYMEALSATDVDEQERLLGEHARHVRQHLAHLDSKAYWERFENSPDFVVMFVPNDEVLLAAMRADRKLAEEVQRRNVVIATPMNLMALLRIIALGWRHEILAANAREVEQLGRQLHKRLGTFAGRLQALGKKVGSLVKGYNEAVGSFEKSVLPSARRFTELGAAPDGSALPVGGQVMGLPRELRAPELAEEAPDSDRTAALLQGGVDSERGDSRATEAARLLDPGNDGSASSAQKDIDGDPDEDEEVDAA
ncbi:MAG TPA: DNA recombination protein RmuC [Solirubrobacteraceae bacterium]|nr:DNA recombination protein RmuC [Solirubrobacteraceae bacterium]